MACANLLESFLEIKKRSSIHVSGEPLLYKFLQTHQPLRQSRVHVNILSIYLALHT